MSAHCSAGAAAATAAAAAGAVLGLGVPRAFPLVASLTDAPLPCQAQLYFVARLEPTRVCWKSDQVHTTRLETGSKCAGVQRCQVCARFNTKAHTADCTHQKLFSVSTIWDLSVPPQLSITPTLVLDVNCGVFIQTHNQLFDEDPDLEKRISS